MARGGASAGRIMRRTAASTRACSTFSRVCRVDRTGWPVDGLGGAHCRRFLASCDKLREPSARSLRDRMIVDPCLPPRRRRRTLLALPLRLQEQLLFDQSMRPERVVDARHRELQFGRQTNICPDKTPFATGALNREADPRWQSP
jgi:hypothetical protein